jgi:protoheme IX farnesyltransferase
MKTKSLTPSYRGLTPRLVFDLFKLRIGFAIALTALAGAAVAPGSAGAMAVAVMGLAVLVASAAAGAFNQYVEADLDRHMQRTRARAFATGRLSHHRGWPVFIAGMVGGATMAAAWLVNPVCALYTFLGAFFYGVVYTVWLKRRTAMNIVVGGLAGSFAVLAGAAAVSPAAALAPLPLAFATILFFWTPPHFWSLAIVYREDYERAGVPMLPVVCGDARAARVVFSSAVLLAGSSLVPLAFGMGAIYAAGAIAGGVLFVRAAARLARTAGAGATRERIRQAARSSFRASLVQLALLLVAAIADRVV